MLKVLIAEDSDMLARLFEDYLTLIGHEVVGIAHCVGDAVALARTHSPDVAVVDYRLGDRECGTQIRLLLGPTSQTAILYVSGLPLGETLTNLDGEGFIQKPVSLHDLDRALQAVRQIKIEGHVAPGTSPRGFRPLAEPASGLLRSG